MTLQQLIYVIEIDKYGSFNAAANNLFISQPTISVAIKELEDEIGYKIFLRTNKGTELTSNGIEFIHYAKNVLIEYEKLCDTFTQKKVTNKLKFRVSSQHYAFLSEAFVKFLEQYNYDSYNFVIKETKSLEAIEDVFQRKSDFAIILINDYNRTVLEDVFLKKGIDFHILANPKPHVTFRKNHPLANFKTITLEQLIDYPAIIFEQDGNDLLSEELIIQKQLPKVVFVNDRASLINIVINSDAYNIGTGYISKEMLDSGMVVKPMYLLHDSTQEIGWIHLKKYKPSIVTYQFIDIIKELLKSYETKLSNK